MSFSQDATRVVVARAHAPSSPSQASSSQQQLRMGDRVVVFGQTPPTVRALQLSELFAQQASNASGSDAPRYRRLGEFAAAIVAMSPAERRRLLHAFYSKRHPDIASQLQA